MGSLFKKPKVTPPDPMPDREDPAILAASRKAADDERKRSGRSSTMLSGDSYGGSKLGGQG